MNMTQILQSSLQSSSPLAILIAFAGGILTSLTPCVYPLIPVTIAFIGGLSKGNRKASFFYSLLYVSGISAVYASLGAFAATTGTMFGSWASSPVGFLIMGNICLIFALSFFDLFEINFSLVKSGNIRKGNAAVIAFLTGCMAALTASACTAPILAVLLTYVAQKQNIIYGGALLFSFAFGMSLLLLAAGTFSGFLSSLPRAGRWMLRVKYFFGILLLLMGEYYLITAGKNMASSTSSYESDNVKPVKQTEETVSADVSLPLPPARSFSFPDLTLNFCDRNESFNLYSEIGKKNIVLLFFATWCPGCMEELPEISKIQNDFPDTRFLAVNIKESADKVMSVFSSKGISVECLSDKNGEYAKAFKVQYIPACFMIDKSGNMVLSGSATVPDIIEKLRGLDAK